MRAFLGLPLPDPVLDAMEDLQAEIPVGRSVPPENLHITLAFLDDQPAAVLDALHQELCEVTAPGLSLSVQGLDLMGGKSPKVLCANIAPNAALTQLHSRLRTRVQAAGIELPRARFRPHVTLLRFARRLDSGALAKIGHALQAHGDFSIKDVPVESFNLYRSTLLPEGPRYDVLAQYPLDGLPERGRNGTG
ncbi:RNA 2',3'-cyclic phosphodiesterase [Pseudophaeobacter leonis]|uniref:RNA 2',3'-cyclic phosphodiesterase n=1 Tax=Pseudophaeobacter leonis TaxID=1144477 RepID=UPI0009F3BC7A|nr:RNA 2',3'-cyclic phosphodiesterase [Pseudophaeobacter leonis]